MVLIGVTAPSSSDFWPTPLGLNFVDRVPGVYLQAQMISQLLSAARDERSLLTVWSWWQESLWILGWILIGTATAIGFAQSRGRWVSFVIANFCLVLGSYCLLLMGFWVPLLPPLVAMGLAHGGSRLPPKLQRRKLSREGNP
ncbi:MAG: CHASE2 domain-containing protein [Cyanobacteria bacterium P01_H01_bin.15]